MATLGTGVSLQHWDTSNNRRARLAVDETDASNVVRLNQLQLKELHVPAAGELELEDTSGAAVGTFRSTGAHSLGKANASVTFDGSVVITQDLTVTGTTTTVSSTEVQISDNVLVLNSGPSGTKDAGWLAQRYETDVFGDTAALYGAAQSGGSSTITLGVGASTVDDFYNDWYLKIDGGTGSGQTKKITDYVGSTLVATVDTAWGTQPDNTSTYGLYNRPFVGMVYDESADKMSMAAVVADSTGTFTIQDYVDLRVGGLTADDLSQFTGYADFDAGLSLAANMSIAGDGALDMYTTTGALTLRSTDDNVVVRVGDAAGAKKFSVQDNSTSEVASVDSDGLATFAGGLSVTGGSVTATGISLGSGTGELGDLYSSGFLRLGESTGSPTQVGNKGFVYALDVSGATELHYLDSAGNAVQITSGGSVSGATASLDGAYDAGRTITVDAGELVLNVTDTNSNNDGLFINAQDNDGAGVLLQLQLSAEAWSGAPTGLKIDYANSSSLTSSSDVPAISLLGEANGGSGDSIGLSIDAGWDSGIENASVLLQSAAATFSSGELLVSGGNVQLNDNITLSLGTGDDVTMAWATTGSKFDFDVAGAVEIDSTGALSIESSAGVISIGADNVNQNINLGTAGARTIGLGNASATLDVDASVKLVYTEDFAVDGIAVDTGLSANEFCILQNDGANSPEVAQGTAAGTGGGDKLIGVYNGSGVVDRGPVTVKYSVSGTTDIGTVMYLDTTGGRVTESAPSNSGEWVRAVGRLVDRIAASGTGTARLWLQLDAEPMQNPS